MLYEFGIAGYIIQPAYPSIGNIDANNYKNAAKYMFKHIAILNNLAKLLSVSNLSYWPQNCRVTLN